MWEEYIIIFAMTVKKTTIKTKKSGTVKTKRKTNKKSEPKVLEWGREEVIEPVKESVSSPENMSEVLVATETHVTETPVTESSTVSSLGGMEVEEEPIPASPEEAGLLMTPDGGVNKEVKTSAANRALMIFVVVGLLVVGGFAFFSMSKKQTTSTVRTTPTITPVVTVEVTPTLAPVEAPMPGILVLNATGISGLAGKLANQLKAEGFEDVTTGNSSLEVSGNMVNVPEGATISASLSTALTDIEFAPFETGMSTSGKIEVIIGKK